MPVHPDWRGTSSDRRRSTSPVSISTGNEISIEADEYEARVYQHEVDHLDGVLLVEAQAR